MAFRSNLGRACAVVAVLASVGVYAYSLSAAEKAKPLSKAQRQARADQTNRWTYGNHVADYKYCVAVRKRYSPHFQSDLSTEELDRLEEIQLLDNPVSNEATITLFIHANKLPLLKERLGKRAKELAKSKSWHVRNSAVMIANAYDVPEMEYTFRSYVDQLEVESKSNRAQLSYLNDDLEQFSYCCPAKDANLWINQRFLKERVYQYLSRT